MSWSGREENLQKDQKKLPLRPIILPKQLAIEHIRELIKQEKGGNLEFSLFFLASIYLHLALKK